MIRATRLLPAGSFSAEPADRLHLDRDDRHRRRLVMRCAGGTAFLLDLPEAKVMKQGDGLELEDGRIVLVTARPERLLEITAEDTAHLVRLAWHLGNRHLPTQLAGDRLLIREDHVIEDMALKLGAKVAHVSAPFDPEGGAYGLGTVQGHDHGHHDHVHGDHDHAHAHDHAGHDHAGHDHKKHDHDHDHGHSHGPGCGCGHSHDH
ncbi:urease accessory protein UreE [Methylobrevis pamukkalensis]|uniref:Urease accessory protein UreE n=1 Tax=Methylobrevis pamukkalensis TaxID=1439726 RepID=A0A1E3H6U0_9HYPH|nr:urease accessory protein UreE [Methylobrevis pamukkalensis]ODN72048.1 Urease accessory protein UreE 1 [Methylobrevis pamukkalensis]